MRLQQRTTLGHVLMQVGLGLRTGSACVAGALFAALVLGVPLFALARGGAYPEPFALLRSGASTVGAGTWCWQGLAMVAGALLAGRVLAATTAGIGWGILPGEHRAVLTRAATPADPRRSPGSAGERPGSDSPAAQVVAHR